MEDWKDMFSSGIKKFWMVLDNEPVINAVNLIFSNKQ